MNRKPVLFFGRDMEHMDGELPNKCDVCTAPLTPTRDTIGFGSYREHPVDWIQLKCREHRMRYQMFVAVGKEVKGLRV